MMNQLHDLESGPSEFDLEGGAASHPVLGPGRRVPRFMAFEEGETPGPYHPALGPGRRVSRSAVSAELELQLELVGTDDRQQTTNTTDAPFRWCCALDLFFPDPDDPNSFVQFGGSGTLISPRHVLTAGHCLFSSVTGSASRRRVVLEVARVRVAPGRNGDSMPFGSALSSVVRYHPTWRASRDPRFDFGVITLSQGIGLRRFSVLGGRELGYWGSRSSGAGTRINPKDRGFLQSKPVNVSGYPADKPSGTQWRAFGSVVHARPAAGAQLIYYDLDTCAGHSGSPVWLRWQEFRNLIAIHTGPCLAGSDCAPATGRPCFPDRQRFTSNRGVLITPETVAQITQWMR